jgi:hypothetical protein
MGMMHHRVGDGLGCETDECEDGEDGERDLDLLAAQFGG